ncbi:MAG: PIG-L family deacetylase [Acidobacteria bacterium]|nr:MAG: PIG-L family deacetylase [Acidobacteriota bacterium]
MGTRDLHSICEGSFPEVISAVRKRLHNFCEFVHIRYNLRMFRLMVITAHPDDEAGNFGGSLRLYRDRGAETCVICLTPGQAATNRGPAKSDRELAELRRQEFVASCEILRVTEPIVLDYPDGQLHRQELNRVVYDLAQRIRKFRPQVLLTFGAEGGITGHPDHSMAGIFATLAFHWAGRSNRYADQLEAGVVPHRTQKLYHGTSEFALPNRQPINFPPASAIIDIGDHVETKIAAFKAHTTQSPLFPLFEENIRKHGAQEMFHLAAHSHADHASHETDLFAGIKEN